MNLLELRQQIDTIDNELIRLFAQRMDTTAQIAAFKKENNLPVLDPGREREKLQDIYSKAPEAYKEYAVSLYSLLFELSRSNQHRVLDKRTPIAEQIAHAIANTPPLFPSDASVACQGVEGAYSQIACEKLFKMPQLLYFSTFDSVFSAVEKGLCRYGLIPLENSTAGSVNMVYDLMRKHDFRIVRSVRIKIDHNLLAKPGTDISQVREIFSHEQAISQCSEFLRSRPDIKVTCCENTAVAAQMVAKSERSDVAALASRSCIDLYGLKCLASSVQDQGNNFTRFICIAKELEIYPGANCTSLMMVLPHRAGSLYKVLSRFYALGINLNKLESRPIPERNFEFMFYFDLDTSIYSPQFIQLMGELPEICEEFSYLGSYSEVI